MISSTARHVMHPNPTPGSALPPLLPVLSLLFSSLSLLQGCATHTGAPPATSPPIAAAVPTQIIAPRVDGTPRELFARGETALMAQRWQEAADSFEALLAGDPQGGMTPAALLDLGLAYEGLDQREKARDRYHELATRFPSDPYARTALSNACAIHAWLEEWQPLLDTASTLLARKDLTDVDRMTGLGARGLAEVELGKTDLAARDIEDGLDVVESTHYGALNRLPVAAAQLRFALGELRRARSEQVVLQTPGPSLTPAEFLARMDARCGLLLSAQSAYADAMRSVDPHQAAMSGYRVGEMYRKLHHDLMALPPVAAARSDRQKQLHYGMMHVRYRVLLEKGIEMMRRTLELAAKTGDTSVWVKRAEGAKQEMDLALDDEKAQIAALPFTAEELQKALDLLEKKMTGTVAPKESPPPKDRGVIEPGLPRPVLDTSHATRYPCAPRLPGVLIAFATSPSRTDARGGRAERPAEPVHLPLNDLESLTI